MKNSSQSSSSPRRQPGGQPGNQNARKHGAYARHFVTEKEREIFNDLQTQLAKDFKKESEADPLELDMVCLMALRHGAALEKGEIDIAIKLDAALRNHLVALKATRASQGHRDKPQSQPLSEIIKDMSTWLMGKYEIVPSVPIIEALLVLTVAAWNSAIGNNILNSEYREVLKKIDWSGVVCNPGLNCVLLMIPTGL